MVSILIPIYSVEKYIERCARSLFEQTYKDIEYIFVNDCTPDKSMTILQRVITDYPERQNSIKIINNPTNKGISAVRVIAIENANGEFIMYADSDDYLERDAVEKLIAKQQETQADIVSGQAILHKFNGTTIIERTHYPNKQTFINDLITKKTSITLWGRLIKKSLYTQHHIQTLEGINIGEDWQVIPQIIYFSDTTAIIPDIIYHYDNSNEVSYTNLWKIHPDNVIKKWECDKMTMKHLYHFFITHDIYFLDIIKIELKKILIRLMIRYCQRYNKSMYQSLKEELKQQDIKLSLLENIVISNYYICMILGYLKTRIINPLINKQ